MGPGAEALHDNTLVWRGESQRPDEVVFYAPGGFTIQTGQQSLVVNGTDIIAYIENLHRRIEALEGQQPPPPPPTDTFEWSIEAEATNLNWPLTKNSDTEASGGEFISATGGRNRSSPRKEASYSFEVPEDGTYFLWARLYGPDEESDAIYIGIDGSWDRPYPAQTGEYLWTRVGPERDSSGKYGVSLNEGDHEIQVGHAELYARLDALFVTDDWDARP